MERLGSLDAVFLAIEGPTSPMSFGSLAVFDGSAPGLDEVRAFVTGKLALVPRCRQRVREAPLHLMRPVWIDDVHFALHHHVRAAALAPGESIEQFVARVMAEPLDRGRPLWEMWVVEDAGDGRWAVLSKLHHCMVDGVAGTDLLAVMMDRAPGIAVPVLDDWTAAAEPSTCDLLCHSLDAVMASVRHHLRSAVQSLVHGPATWRRMRSVAAGARALWLQPSRRDSPLTGPIGVSRRWAHTDASLADVASVRRAFGGTVNDAVLTAVAWGFRELLQARGELLADRTVMALVPVSMRAAGEHGLLDNRVAVTHALLPVGIADVAATHAAVCRHMADVKASHETDASTLLLHSGDHTPSALAAVVARTVVRAQQNLETVATNVPGPQQPLHLCGRRMVKAYPFAPIAGRIRLAVAIWSYCGVLHIGVTGDGESVTDLDVLVRGIDHGFERLVRASR